MRVYTRGVTQELVVTELDISWLPHCFGDFDHNHTDTESWWGMRWRMYSSHRLVWFALPWGHFCASVPQRGTMDTEGNECWAYGDLARFCWPEAGRAAVGAWLTAHSRARAQQVPNYAWSRARWLRVSSTHHFWVSTSMLARGTEFICLLNGADSNIGIWLGFDWDLWFPLPARRPSNGSGFPLECLSGMWHPPSVFERGGFSHLIWQPIVRRTLTFPLISERRL